MENYRKKNALNNAKTARWHIQNALEQLQPGEEMSLELAARFLMNAAQELYKAATYVARVDESGTDSDVDEVQREIYNRFFADIKLGQQMEL